MKFKKHLIVLSATLLVFVLFASVTYASPIQGQLTFKADQVYYEGNTVVIHGYWLNQTNKYIPYTNWVNMNVYTWNGYWEIVTSATFTRRDYIRLAPGESQYWTYRIFNCQIKPLDRWWIQYQVNFHYINTEDM